jgi:hypothetical protein
MPAPKSRTGSVISVVFTSLLAPIIVSAFSAAIKREPAEAIVEARHVIVRPATPMHAEPAVTLLPPPGATVSAYRGLPSEFVSVQGEK